MKLTVNKCLFFLGIVYVGWCLWISLTHPMAYNYLIRLYSVVSIYMFSMLCVYGKKTWRDGYFFNALAYALTTFGVCLWMVDSWHFELGSFQYWVPIIMGLIVQMKKINFNWLQGFFLGYWALILIDLLTAHQEDYFHNVTHALGYEGTQFALSNYWALAIAIIIYGVATKKPEKQTGIAPVVPMPRRDGSTPPPPLRKRPENRTDLR